MRPRRKQLPINQIRAQREDEFRATPGKFPGSVRVSVNDDETGMWAAIEVGTGDIPDLIRLLEDACADAQAALEQSVETRRAD